MSTRRKKPAAPPLAAPPPCPIPTEWKVTRRWDSCHHVCQRVRQIVKAIAAGEFHIPVFQRPYTWTDAQVIRLLDSLVDGYTVGPLLCWERAAKDVPAVSRLAGLGFPVGDGWTKLVVVDGQQRLSALALAFFSGRFAYDCTARRFVVDAPPDPDRLPLSTLLDASWRVGGPMDVWTSGTPDGEHKFFWLEEMLCSADLSIVTLPERWTVERVVESYRRLATEGTPMDPAHLAEGLARMAAEVKP